MLFLARVAGCLIAVDGTLGLHNKLHLVGVWACVHTWCVCVSIGTVADCSGWES